MTQIGEGAEYALDLGYKPSQPVVRSDADAGGDIACQVDSSRQRLVVEGKGLIGWSYV